MEHKRYRFDGTQYIPKDHSWENINPYDFSQLSYGDFRLDDNGEFLFIPYTTYSDYSGDTVERSNCDVFLEKFQDNKEGIWEVIGGFNTRGVVIHQSLLEDEEVQEILEGLDNYPLIDEDHFSELETTLENESWDLWVKDDLIFQLEKNNIAYDENTLEEKFWSILSEHDIYFIHEDAVSPYMDIDEVIKFWNE